VHAVEPEPHAEELQTEQVVLGLTHVHPRLSSSRR
jgi:hypothetical protein